MNVLHQSLSTDAGKTEMFSDSRMLAKRKRQHANSYRFNPWMHALRLCLIC